MIKRLFNIKSSVLLLKFLLLLGFIYVFQQKVFDGQYTYRIINVNYIAVFPLIFLVFINWYLEYVKWRIITEANQFNEEKINIQAFFAGVLGSFLTPSIAGNFLGRIWYYPSSLRWKIGVHSSLANLSQTIVAICFGIPVLLYTNLYTLHSLLWFVFSLVFLVSMYLWLDRFFIKFPWQKIRIMSKNLLSSTIRLKFLAISFLRYLVMLAQYICALLVFNAELTIGWIAPIVLVFLFVTLTPSLFFGKIIVRESIALTVFSFFALPLNEVFFASLLIWVLSIFLPAMYALLVTRVPKIYSV